MVKIQNDEIVKNFVDALKVSMSEGFPTEASSNVVPVIDVTPYNRLETINGSLNTTGAADVYSAAANKRLRIFGFTMSLVKDATCDAADGNFSVTYTQGGIVKTLGSLPFLTLTAQQDQTEVALPYPIYTDPGTAVSIASNTFTAGKMRRNVTLYCVEELKN